MEFGKSMDVSAFDWDDTALIEEYDRIMKSTKKAISKSKGGKSSQNKEKAKENKRPFEVGDYCQAMYKEDGLFYEATIVDIHGDTCTVEFLGYGDLEEVTLDSLEESDGRRARQKQRKKAKRAGTAENYVSDSDLSIAEERDQIDRSVKQTHPQYNNNTYQQWDLYSREQSAQPLQPSYFTPSGAFNQTSAPFPPPPPVNCVQRVGDNMHCPMPPPPPPMPNCSAVAKDPSLSAMLVSWYMAGYYTGLHQNQKTSHCSAAPKTHCCDHHHHT